MQWEIHNIPVDKRGGCGVRNKSLKMQRRVAQLKKKERNRRCDG